MTEWTTYYPTTLGQGPQGVSHETHEIQWLSSFATWEDIPDPAWSQWCDYRYRLRTDTSDLTKMSDAELEAERATNLAKVEAIDAEILRREDDQWLEVFARALEISGRDGSGHRVRHDPDDRDRAAARFLRDRCKQGEL